MLVKTDIIIVHFCKFSDFFIYFSVRKTISEKLFCLKPAFWDFSQVKIPQSPALNFSLLQY